MTDIIRSLGSTAIIAVGPGRRIPIVRSTTHPNARWKFPGGHVEEYDRSIADSVKRELLEETGLRLSGKAHYLSSALRVDHSIYIYYGEVASWDDLGKGVREEEVFLATAREIFSISDFSRGHQRILNEAIQKLERRGIRLL